MAVAVFAIVIYDPGSPAERFDHGQKVGALVQLKKYGEITIELRGSAGPLTAKWMLCDPNGECR